MARTTSTQVHARERARERLAQRHAEARAREKATQDDLAAFLTLDATLTTATQTRDAAVAAATRAYDTAVTATHTAQAQKVAAMLARGDTAAQLAELTGWTPTQIRAAAKTATASDAATVPEPDEAATVAPETGGAGGCSHVVGGVADDGWDRGGVGVVSDPGVG